MRKHYAVLALLVAGGLAGCATTPNMHYVGVAPQANIVHKNVTLVTTVTDGNFNRTGCILAVSHKCKEFTFSKKELTENYDKLLSSALDQSGALPTAVPSLPATGWAIQTSISTASGNKYEVLVDYDLGKSIGMAMIPVYGLFSPHYYTMHVTLLDHIRIYHDGKLVWTKVVSVNAKKHISGSHFSIGGTHSEDAYRVYRENQSKAVTSTMLALNQAMTAQKGE